MKNKSILLRFLTILLLVPYSTGSCDYITVSHSVTPPPFFCVPDDTEFQLEDSSVRVGTRFSLK